jgi:hypothetical protein
MRNPQIFKITTVFLLMLSLSSVSHSSETDDVKAISKDSNFVVLNRLEDFNGDKKKINGIYIIPATGKSLEPIPAFSGRKT